MSLSDLVLVGCPAPVPIRPRALLRELDVAEAVVLATCERTEVYACGELDAMRVALPDAPWRTARGAAVVAHLLRVAATLESRRVGEPEIQGQLRAAGRLAAEEEMLGPRLRDLWRHALVTGKRVRRQTAIGRGTASLPAAVVARARATLGTLESRRAVVVGAGALGSAVGGALARQGLADLVVLNRRSPAPLAARLGARSGDLGQLAAELVRADVAVFCTGAPGPVISRADLPDRPLLVFDLAVPADVDPSATGLPTVQLIALDELAAAGRRQLERRRREATRAETIVAEELRRYLARAAAPALAAAA
jgi:glutamyl-tRNA reductase